MWERSLDLLALCWESRLIRPGAPADHGPSPCAAESQRRADPESLLARADAAADSAAQRYNETCGGLVRCTCVGQPRCENATSLVFTDCEMDLQAWRIPTWADRIRLAFKWDILENEGSTFPLHSAISVVPLKKAEQHGVPLPEDWESVIFECAQSVSAAAGVF